MLLPAGGGELSPPQGSPTHIRVLTKYKSYQLSASVYGAQMDIQKPPATQPKHRMSDIEQPNPKFSSIREVEEE